MSNMTAYWQTTQSTLRDKLIAVKGLCSIGHNFIIIFMPWYVIPRVLKLANVKMYVQMVTIGTRKL